MQLPVGGGWSMMPAMQHPGQSNSAYPPPPYPTFQSNSAMPGYPTFYPPPPLHGMPQHPHLGYGPPQPSLGYQQPSTSNSSMSSLTASMGAVRPPSMPALTAPQQPPPHTPLFIPHPPIFSSSASLYGHQSTDGYMSSTSVPALMYQPQQQPQPQAQSRASHSTPQPSLVLTPTGKSASPLSSPKFTPRTPTSRVVSRATSSVAIGANSVSSEAKRKRKRDRPAKDASARRSTGAGDSESSGEGDTDDKEKEEKTDSEGDDVSVMNEAIMSLHDASNATGKSNAGGLGQYELELLQREVDELHDEAMAERLRADEVDDRHLRLLQKGRQLAAKCSQLDTVLQAALAAAVPQNENTVLLRWDIQLSVLYAEMKAVLNDLVESSTADNEAAVHTARSQLPASSVAHARLSRFLSKSAGERFCKPCRLITTLSKRPFRVLLVDVQRQYTMSKKETRRMTKEEKERLVSVPLRIMGSAHRNNIYFVAKDVCILIHTRKGNVAKSIGQFSEKQKARMPVLCVRSNGTVSTHILTVLTVEGVQRLLGASRSMLAPQVLAWILQQVELICADNPDDPPPTSSNNTTASSPSSASSSSPGTATTDASAP